MPNAVIYARYSSHAQRDVSIDQQVLACREFAASGGIDVLDVYADRATTGTNDRRPAFQKMINDAKNGEWQYVIVYTLDRFSRDRYDSAVYKRQLRNCGVKVLSAMEQITDDPTGVIMESILEGYAEYYSKELSRKVRRGHEDNARKCMVNGRCPLGYRRGDDGKYVIVEQEAEVVREIFHRVAAGEALTSIADDFNRRGLKTKKGAAYNKSSFNQILSNERYIGVYTYQDIRIPDGIPAIVTREEFDAVQNAVTKKKNPRRSVSADAPQPRRREDGIYLLTGKLFCGECGRPMVGVSGTGKSGNLHHYYRCKGHSDGCNLKNVRQDDIEKDIANVLKTAMLSDEGIAALAHASYQMQIESRSAPDIDLLEAQLKDTEKALNNILAAIEQGIFTVSTRDRLQQLENQKSLLQQQLDSARQSADDIMTETEIAAVLRHYADGDIDDKAYQETLIDAFLVRAYVFADHYRIYFTTDPDSPVEYQLPKDSSTLEGSYNDAELRPITAAAPVAAVFSWRRYYEKEHNGCQNETAYPYAHVGCGDRSTDTVCRFGGAPRRLRGNAGRLQG